MGETLAGERNSWKRGVKIDNEGKSLERGGNDEQERKTSEKKKDDARDPDRVKKTESVMHDFSL